MPNVERDHDKESTHYVCFERMAESKGKAECCGCTGHVCQKDKTITKTFKLGAKTHYTDDSVISLTPKQLSQLAKVFQKLGEARGIIREIMFPEPPEKE